MDTFIVSIFQMRKLLNGEIKWLIQGALLLRVGELEFQSQQPGST